MAQSIYKTLAETSFANRAIYLICMAIMFVGIVMLITIGGKHVYLIVKHIRFAILYAAIGLILALLIIAALKSIKRNLFTNRTLRLGIIWFLLFGLVNISVSGASYINYKYAKPDVTYYSFKIIKKYTWHSKNAVHYTIDLTYSDIEKELTIGYGAYVDLEVGKYVRGGIRHGALGFDFVEFAKGTNH